MATVTWPIPFKRELYTTAHSCDSHTMTYSTSFDWKWFMSMDINKLKKNVINYNQVLAFSSCIRKINNTTWQKRPKLEGSWGYSLSATIAAFAEISWNKLGRKSLLQVKLTFCHKKPKATHTGVNITCLTHSQLPVLSSTIFFNFSSFRVNMTIMRLAFCPFCQISR